MDQQKQFEELQERYQNLKAEVYGEALDELTTLETEIAKKEHEYKELLNESDLTNAKINNTESMKKHNEWDKIADILRKKN